jgi:hypothetical protein
MNLMDGEFNSTDEKTDEKTLLSLQERRRAEMGSLVRVNRPAGSTNRNTLIARQILADASKDKVKALLSLCEEVPENTEPCPMCGRGMRRNEDTRLKAILAVLDRGGLGPTQKLELEKSETDTEWMQYATDEELVAVHAIMERAKSRAANVMELEAPVAP